MTISGCNPGNVRWTGVLWDGLDTPPSDSGGFCRFKTMEDGVRALCKILLAYQDKHGLRTIEQIINRWAPSSENDTGAYVADVAHRMGVGADEDIDVHSAGVLSALAGAIAIHETGHHLDVAAIAGGAQRALG